ncbi:MAG: hypothetical protein KAG98_07185 [Lentisphaeria bacterium]|nr:hypothetical protein [Lentisphaeria bacterium]
MTIRVIYYTAADRKKYGDLQMRRQSALFEEHNFKFEDEFSLREERGKWFLKPIYGVSLFSDESLITGEQAIKSGFSFNSADTYYKIVNEHSYVPRSRMGTMISLLTALIILLILFAELFLVIWLPKKWSEIADLSKQVTIQKSEIKLDAVRNRFRKDVKKGSPSYKEANVFLFQEMNRIADYFRTNRTVMTVEEVEAMYERLKGYEKIADLLEGGIDFDKKVEPNISQWLEEKCKDTSNEKSL